MKPEFDELIHAPNRLRICAALSTVREAEFSVVRDAIEVSDSVLSKQVCLLQEAGYVKVSKATVNTRQRTWLALTGKGRRAFRAHMLELRRLADAGVAGA